jgi:glyoxylase-like metal-dependent hydrolase (beta-lactamase superfamily II)
MTPLFPGIWHWSWFSEEKQLDFNGLLLNLGNHRILVDPPPLSPEDQAELARGGGVDCILITNRDHEREAAALKQAFRCPVWVPEADAAQMMLKPDCTYTDGAVLPGGMRAIQLEGQKSPGESALWLEQGEGILIVGDAFIGKPPGSVSLLPPEKYADVSKAREGLKRLLRYRFDALLVGDGVSILSGAKAVVERFLA